MQKVWPGKRSKRHLIALLLYGALAIWLTWPLSSRLSDVLAGRSTDAFMHYWNAWWVRQALTIGQSPFFTDYIFYPEGASLVYHNFAWLTIVPWLILQSVLNDLVAYNLVYLASLVFCGYAAFTLARYLTNDFLAALLSGLIYMAWPFRISQLDHPNLISTGWIPLFMLFLIRTVREGRWQHAVLAGLSLGLVGYTRWQLLIPTGILAIIYLLTTLPAWVKERQRWMVIALLALIAIMMLLPPASLLISQQIAGHGSSEDLLREGEEAIMQVDVMSYVTPPPDNDILGKYTGPIYDRYYADRSPSRRFSSYIGIATLLLAVVGVWRKRRTTLPWLLMAITLMLFAIGPVMRLNGQLVEEIPTLYRFMEPLYIFRLIRVPERFNMVLALPLAVLAAYGAAEVLEKIRHSARSRSWYPAAATASMCLLILFEFDSGPAPVQDTEVSPYFQELRDVPDDFAVLSLPIDPIQAKNQMLAQTTHNRPLVSGKISRFPPGVYNFIDNHPLLRVLRQSSEMPIWLEDVSQQLDSLAQEGIAYVIMHKDLIGADRVEHWQNYMATEPIYEDELIAVYRTDIQASRDFEIEKEIKPGLGSVKYFVTADCFQPGQPMEVDIAWGTANPVSSSGEVMIMLRNLGGELTQTMTFPMTKIVKTDEWPADSLVWGYYPLIIDEDLSPGEYTLEVCFSEPNPDDTFVLKKLSISKQACPELLPEEAAAVNALFGSEMRLLGYELERPSDDRLLLTLYWRNEQRTEIDYKVFVHIFEPETGIPAAQDDSMPRRGGLPTRFWVPGDVIVDNISVDLSEVPPGDYGLAVGVYDPQSLIRQPLIKNDGSKPEDRRLILAEPGGIRLP